MFEKDLEQIKESRDTCEFMIHKYPTVSVFKQTYNRLNEIVWAYKMMRSCLVYGEDFKQRFKDYEEYLTEEELLEMYEAYKEYFAEHVEVTRNAGIDSEGVTYNSSREK